MQNNNENTSKQTQIVTTKKVSCNGDALNSHHPLVYLNLGEKNSVVCPYCGKHFILQQK
ncbi:MAG: zinc-finger domain-containing protein [Proteobacteria bacterium]|jgi:uncharacterized Zn-finger protein|nr:zinc-finger domain-containing protein [Pseudomonadota bacterium]